MVSEVMNNVECIYGSLKKISEDEKIKLLLKEYERISRNDISQINEIVERALKKGRKEARKCIALKALRKDMSLEEVSELTNLTFDEINELRDN